MAGRQASAVIVRARLPAGLERLRRRSVADAAEGVPAHLTLLYPFVEPRLLDASVRRTIAAVAARHAPFHYRLDRAARWPDTVYVASPGHLFGPNAERGIFKTTDGGKTWIKAKFINEDTGFTDVAIDHQSFIIGDRFTGATIALRLRKLRP